MSRKKGIDRLELLNLLFDFILDTGITDRERKIGLMAKDDLEKKKYTFAVLNKLIVSFQIEAMKNKGLSVQASKFYHKIYPMFIASKPFGLNLGYIGLHSTYLD